MPCQNARRMRCLPTRAYDADTIRADVARRNIEPVIHGRSNRWVKIDHDRKLYKQRNRIERMFGHLKINLAIARYWFKFFHAA